MADIFALIDGNDLAGLRALLAHTPAAAAARDAQGLSAIMRAAYRGRAMLDVVHDANPPVDAWDRIMLGESTDLPAPDAWSPDGFQPLHLAAFAHNAAAARALLAAGADANQISRSRFAAVTPLGTAAFARAIEVARVLMAHGANPHLPDEAHSPIATARSNHDADLLAVLTS